MFFWNKVWKMLKDWGEKKSGWDIGKDKERAEKKW